MNPLPGQGLAGRPNGQNIQAAQGAAVPNRQQTPLYRPEMMRSITFLTEDEKAKYEKGLAGLWKEHDGAVPGSPQQEGAKKKIAEFGRMLVNKIHQRRQAVQHQQAQQQAQQAQAQQQTQQAQQMPQQPQQPQQQPLQQPVQQPGQVGGAVPMAQQQAAVAQGGVRPPTNTANPPAQPAAAGAQASPNAVAATAQARSLPSHIMAHLNDIQFAPPPNIPDKAKWLEEIKTKYSRALMVMENARTNTKTIEQTLAENQSLPPEERKKLEERKIQLGKQYQEAISFANLVRKQYATGGNQRPAQNGAAAPNAANQARPQTSGAQGGPQPGQGVTNGAPIPVPANPMQSSTAAVNAAIEAAKKQQLAAAGRVPGAVNALPAQQGQPPQPHQPQVQAPATPAQAQQSPVTPVPPAQSLASQPQPPQAHQPQQVHHPTPPVKIEPGTQPLPTPLNTALASAAAGGIPSVGTPTQNSARLQTPQSATPTTANANIRPLTHAAAVNLASQARPGSIPAAPATGPGNPPASGLTVIGGAQQQQGHPHAHPSQPQPTAQNLQSKLPIPKVLHEKATQMPTPVPNIGGIGSTGRPTYSGGGGIGGGVMNQPALSKIPAFQLDGEGERILNKKKLDELVRQVCGGSAEGQEGNMLTPEVEEVSWILFSPNLFLCFLPRSASRCLFSFFFIFISWLTQNNSLSSPWPIPSSTTFFTRLAGTPRSEAPRSWRSATSSSFLSVPTTSASPATRARSCGRSARSSPTAPGLRR